MAYCDKCGAYMPDGVTKCFACGYNAAEEAAKAEKAAKAAATQAQQHKEDDTTYHFRNDDEKYREQLEENRRRQQELNRKWADQEYARRKAAEQQRAQRSTESGSFTPGVRKMDSGKLWSILSYVSVLCLVPYLTEKGGDEANFHASQGLRLLVFGAVADVLGKLFLVGWLFHAARVILMLTGIYNAVNSIRRPLPVIGTIGPH